MKFAQKWKLRRYRMLQTYQFVNHGVSLYHKCTELFWRRHPDWFSCSLVGLSFDRRYDLCFCLLSDIEHSRLEPAFSNLLNSISLTDRRFVRDANWNLGWNLGLCTSRNSHTLPVYYGLVGYWVCLFRQLALGRLFLGQFFIGTLRSGPTPSNACVSTSSEANTDCRYFSMNAIFGQHFCRVDKKDCVLRDWSFVCC